VNDRISCIRYAYTQGMTTTQNNIFIHDWQTHSDEEQNANQYKHNENTKGHDFCHLCGRLISDKALPTSWWVHQRTDGALIAVDYSSDLGEGFQSQGWFPIGAGCAKKIPSTHKMKFSEVK